MARPRIAGRYELHSPAGVGGMGSVWRGVTLGEAGFTRRVAIKRMLPWLKKDPANVRLFAEEARVISELSHPHIVQVHDFCRDDDGGYVLVMEWVDGLDLRRWIAAYAQGGDLTPWPIVLGIGIEVCRGLSAAHERLDADGSPAPVFHRDITPGNVLIGDNGVTKLADFGMARRMDRNTFTRPGVLKGKLAYMAPEYIGGTKANVTTDVYSVGVVLWEALTGRRLRDEADPVKLYAMASEPVPRVDSVRDDMPAAVVHLIEQTLARKPEERFESARAMVEAMKHIVRTHAETPTDDLAIAETVRFAKDRLARSMGG